MFLDHLEVKRFCSVSLNRSHTMFIGYWSDQECAIVNIAENTWKNVQSIDDTFVNDGSTIMFFDGCSAASTINRHGSKTVMVMLRYVNYPFNGNTFSLMAYDIANNQWTQKMTLNEDNRIEKIQGSLLFIYGQLTHILSDGSILEWTEEDTWQLVKKYEFNQAIETVIPYYV